MLFMCDPYGLFYEISQGPLLQKSFNFNPNMDK